MGWCVMGWSSKDKQIHRCPVVFETKLMAQLWAHHFSYGYPESVFNVEEL